MKRFIFLSLITIAGLRVNAQALKTIHPVAATSKKLYSSRLKSANFSNELSSSTGKAFGYVDEFVTLGTVQAITGFKTFNIGAKFLGTVNMGLSQDVNNEYGWVSPALRVGYSFESDNVVESSNYMALGTDRIDNFNYIQGWSQPGNLSLNEFWATPVQINPFGGSASVGPLWIQDVYNTQFSIQGESGKSILKAYDDQYLTAFEIANNGNIFSRTLNVSGLANINTGANADNTALVLTGNEPDIVFNQTKANGFSTFTWKRSGSTRLAFGMNSADDFYLTRNLNGTWNDNTFRVIRNNGNVLVGKSSDNGVDKLQVDGFVEAKGVKLIQGTDLQFFGGGANGDDTGDIVFNNSAGTEMGRLWYDNANQFLIRFGSSAPAYNLWHSGNVNELKSSLGLGGFTPANYIGNGYNSPTNVLTRTNSPHGFNSAPANSFSVFDNYDNTAIDNAPYSSLNWQSIQVGDKVRGFQVASDYANNNIFYRRWLDNGASGWMNFWHSGNFNPANYYTNNAGILKENTNANNLTQTGTYDFQTGNGGNNLNYPTLTSQYGNLLHFKSDNFNTQFLLTTANEFYFRNTYLSNYPTWEKLWHSGNTGSLIENVKANFGEKLKLMTSQLDGGVLAYEFSHYNAARTKNAIVSNTLNNWGRGDLHFVVNTEQNNNAYNLANDTRLFISATDGNVGVGTISPESKLEVKGNVDIKYSSTDEYFLRHKDLSNHILAGFKRDGNNLLIRSFDGVKFTTGNQDASAAMSITSVGNVGVGTSTPENNEGWDRVFDVSGTGHSKIIATTSQVQTGIWSHNNGYFGAETGGMTGTNSNHPFSIITNKTVKMTVKSNGYVGIGLSNPTELLTVNGNILTKGIKVNPELIPDYVFKPQYKLPSLREVESYVKENSHLPEVPSEAEVKKNGLELGEMSVILLKKIEELTLYMIEKDKQLEKANQKIEELYQKVDKLESKK